MKEMHRLKLKIWLLSLLLVSIPLNLAAQQRGQRLPPGDGGSGAAGAHSGQGEYYLLPGSGHNCWIGEEYYFTYRFDKRPQIGTAILKIQLFQRSGKRTTDLEIRGEYEMPSMRGAHDSGDQPFRLNKKGDYLLPVNIAMAGEWEVKLTFLKEGKIIYRGSFRFTV
jgi:hypothetical protein